MRAAPTVVPVVDPGRAGDQRPGPLPPLPGRDPVIDLVRAGALVVVVAWHWAFTTLRGLGVGTSVERCLRLCLVRGLGLEAEAAGAVPAAHAD